MAGARGIEDWDFEPFARRLLRNTALLLVVGGVVAFVVFGLTDWPPLLAARDALENANMLQQVQGPPVRTSALHIGLVGIDDTTCTPAAPGGLCTPSVLIDRDKLAGYIAVGAAAGYGVIAIDVLPAPVPECTDATRHLIAAIDAAAARALVILPMPIILLRPVSGGESRYTVGETFFDQCPDEKLVNADRIFQGHALLYPIGVDGISGAVQPWVATNVLTDRPRDKPHVRRRVPALSLLVALAVRHSDLPLRDLLDASGLETRLRTHVEPDTPAAPGTGTGNTLASASPAEGRAGPRPLVYCAAARGCALAITSMAAPDPNPAPLRINFHFGWHETLAPADLSARAKMLDVIDGEDFTPDNAARNQNSSGFNALLIGSAGQSYGDLHASPIGKVPGALIGANAVFSFFDDDFFEDEAGRGPHLAELLDVLYLALAVVVFCAAATAAAALVLPRFRVHATLVEISDWTWPISLGGMAVIAAILAWQQMHVDFSNGVLSFALISALISVVDARQAFEEIAKLGIDVVSGAVQRLTKGSNGGRGQHDSPASKAKAKPAGRAVPRRRS